MGEKNKIKFGLKNVHWALVTEAVQEDGSIKSTYGAIHAWPGAVSMTLDPSGENNNFYADDTVYAVLKSNAGYEGDYESAIIPDDFKKEIFGFVEDSNGVLVEASNTETKYAALMFEIDGDVKARRFVVYRCSFTRGSLGSKTKEDSTEPATDSCTITATPRPDNTVINGMPKNIVQLCTTEKTSAEVYNAWYTKVYEPVEVEAAG